MASRARGSPARLQVRCPERSCIMCFGDYQTSIAATAGTYSIARTRRNWEFFQSGSFIILNLYIRSLGQNTFPRHFGQPSSAGAMPPAGPRTAGIGVIGSASHSRKLLLVYARCVWIGRGFSIHLLPTLYSSSKHLPNDRQGAQLFCDTIRHKLKTSCNFCWLFLLLGS